MVEGTPWFRRFYKECKKMSPHIEFKRIKYGFYRIYFHNGGERAYIHEVYKEMPYKGYHQETVDPNWQDKSYYEEFEDNVQFIRNIKNYVEGYWDSIRRVRTRIYMLKNDKEFRETATKAYKQIHVK